MTLVGLVQLLSARMRAFLLATSPRWRARLMLPMGMQSGAEFPVIRSVSFWTTAKSGIADAVGVTEVNPGS